MFCHNKHLFVTTKVSLSQQNFRRDKIMFVATNICHDKSFVMTKICSTQQAYFCCDKRCILFRQTHVCRNKTFVATKMILTAAPTNDANLHSDHLQALKTEPFTASASVEPHRWQSRGQGDEQKRAREVERESNWRKTVTQTTGHTRQGKPTRTSSLPAHSRTSSAHRTWRCCRC